VDVIAADPEAIVNADEAAAAINLNLRGVDLDLAATLLIF